MDQWRAGQSGIWAISVRGNPGLTPNFSTLKKDITKLIFNHFVKHAVKIGFVQVGVVCAAWWHFAGAFTTKQQLMHPHCFVYYDKTWMQTVMTCFTKNYYWAAIPDPIWTTNVPYERKLNMLSSTDNNFMIFLFDFERFSIESRFPFFNSHCTLIQWNLVITRSLGPSKLPCYIRFLIIYQGKKTKKYKEQGPAKLSCYKRVLLYPTSL